MVEHVEKLNAVFGSLADPTRRDILTRVAEVERPIRDLAEKYDLSFAAVAKHLKVLEDAGLVVKRKKGRNQMISLAPSALKGADKYLEQYRRMWQGRYDKLEALLKTK